VPDTVEPERHAVVAQALAKLRQTWDRECPSFQADLGPLKAQLGLSGADQAFGLRFHYIDGVDGFFYFHARAKAGANCTEITGAEYDDAELATVKRQGRFRDARERARIL